MKLQFPFARPMVLTLTIRSGRQFVLCVWSYNIKYGHGDAITSTEWKYAGGWPRIQLIRADEIAVVEVDTAFWPKWRGWKR